MGKRIAVDIGGTFTDFIIVDDGGNVDVYKTPSTPDAPEQAVFNGLADLADQSEQPMAGYLGSVDLFIHGTTIATNTVIQRSGPKTAVLHTEGFRDVLLFRDGFKEDRYNLHLPPPDDFIPRSLRKGVRERILHDGTIDIALDEVSVRQALETCKQANVDALAVSLLWSMVEPRHERRIAELVQEEMPEAYVALSSEVLPAIREYPRTCATVLSAYVGPVLGRYLTEVAAFLGENGYRYDLLVMQITGGSARVAEIEKRPVLAVGSGPAGGPPAGLAVGALKDERNLMVIDMGGTSFEVSIVTDGEFTMSRDMKIEGVPLGVAAVDMQSVGAGGGSIAWIDKGGMLRVGPRSAGATPGPACYGHGGTSPTVTDANLVLGYLNPEFFLGGRMRLDRGRAEAALETIAAPLGLSVTEAAAAVYRIVNTNMVGAMRAVSVMRGADPRDYTVIVGGGAGGTHAAQIAQDLGIRKVICPMVASGLCAYGMLVADVRHNYLVTYPTATDNLDAAHVSHLFREMEAQALEELSAQGFEADQIVLQRFVDAKYPYQINEITIPVPSGTWGDHVAHDIAAGFHAEHKRRYTYNVEHMPIDLNGWRLTAIGRLPPLPEGPHRNGHRQGGPLKETRAVFFVDVGDRVDTPVFDGEKLAPGDVVVGPAIAELPTTTVLISPNQSLLVDDWGNFTIDLPSSAP